MLHYHHAASMAAAHRGWCKVQIQTQPIQSSTNTSTTQTLSQNSTTTRYIPPCRTVTRFSTLHFVWRSRESLVDVVAVMGRARIATLHGWARGWLGTASPRRNPSLPTPVQCPSVHLLTHPLTLSHIFRHAIPRTHTPLSLNRVHRPLSAPSSDRGDREGVLG
jgi:hypothetical protein